MLQKEVRFVRLILILIVLYFSIEMIILFDESIFGIQIL